MSATIACPPPNDKSESGAKTRMSPIRRLSSTARLHHVKDENAERYDDAHHRHHREAQDADRDEGGECDNDGDPAALDLLQNLQGHRECRGYSDGCRAEQNKMRRRKMLKLAIAVA